ncbi:hypothetical protein DPMN_033131 [Dreissena polymorpha]|uniref:Uncharacterized protein n=1 Tax=Dreissena polymorpha TaxID=45954 RepID=A0A9D4RJJ9_DREPO|nr:hypothetical protein DPMN_033131 [Dreissena polymorpha]
MIFDFPVLTSILYCYFIESADEILKFTVGDTHEANAISESKDEEGSSTDGDQGVVVF